MSVYTTEVRYICEYEAGLIKSTGYNDVDEVVAKAWNKIFKNFPIFDESYREYLCKKILQHYYTREICAETVSLWKFWLNQKMCEIMPYYNKLYMTEQLKFDPLHEIDFTREITENNSDTKTGTSGTDTKNSDIITNTGERENNTTETDSTTNKITSERLITGETENKQVTLGTVTTDASNSGQNLHSDTPQGSIQNIKENGYLTDATITSDKNDSTVTTDSSITNNGNSSTQDANNETHTQTTNKANVASGNNKDTTTSNKNENINHSYSDENIGNRKYLEHVTGKNSSSSYATLVQEYRDSLLNIDLDIIFELRYLFMNIY